MAEKSKAFPDAVSEGNAEKVRAAYQREHDHYLASGRKDRAGGVVAAAKAAGVDIDTPKAAPKAAPKKKVG